MDEAVLSELREFSSESNTDISVLLTEAVGELLLKKRVRPLFTKAADEAFAEFDKALKELAK
jgi:hypothetical protein